MDENFFDAFMGPMYERKYAISYIGIAFFEDYTGHAYSAEVTGEILRFLQKLIHVRELWCDFEAECDAGATPKEWMKANLVC